MEEDLGARFNHNGKKIYKKKTDRRESFNRNNARNRDMYSIAKATGKIDDVSVEDAVQKWENDYQDSSFEDKLIEAIDKKKEELE